VSLNVRQKKRTKISCEESLLQILREKKIEETDQDEDKRFYYHYSHHSGNLTTERSFWLEWQF
jgi:hypothetical protein